MAQIQYPAYTQPPAFTPPTSAQMGWRPSTPDSVMPAQVRTERSGGRGVRNYTALLLPAMVAVFAIEQWAPAKGAVFEGPDNPQQVISGRELGARGGGYRALYDTQSHAVFAVEQWTTAKGWGSEVPDDPRLGRRTRLDGALYAPGFISDPTTPGTTITPVGLSKYPDTTARARLPIAALPWLAARGEAPEQFTSTQGVRLATYPDRVGRFALYWAGLTEVSNASPFDGTLLWNGHAPDQTRRAGLSAAQYAPTPTVDPTAPAPNTPTLRWDAQYPGTTRRASLAPIYYPTTVTDPTTPIVVASTLGWRQAVYPDVCRLPVTYGANRVACEPVFVVEIVTPLRASWITAPDRTTRASLAPVAMPSLALTPLTLESPILAGRVSAPDRIWTLRLPVGEYRSAARGEAPERFTVPALAWLGTHPDTTKRASLSVAVLPFTTRPEAVEKFVVPSRSWAGTWPDTTRRALLPVAVRLEALTFTQRDIVVVVPTQTTWATAPDRTWRRTLPVSEYRSAVRGEAPESMAVPALAWRTIAPHATRRAQLQTASSVSGVAFTHPVLPAPTIQVWRGSHPDVGRRQPFLTLVSPAFMFAFPAQTEPTPLAWLGISPTITPVRRRHPQLDGFVIPWFEAHEANERVSHRPPIHGRRLREGVFAALKAEVFRRLDEAQTSPVFVTEAEVAEALNDGYMELSDTTEWNELSLTIDLLRQRPIYDLRTILGEHLLTVGAAFDDARGRWLLPSTVTELARDDRRWERVEEAAPIRIVPQGLWNVRYWPMQSSDTGSITQYYTALPAALVDDEDAPGFPAMFHQGLVEFALTDLWAGMGEAQLALTAWGRFLEVEAALWGWVNDRAGVPQVGAAGAGGALAPILDPAVARGSAGPGRFAELKDEVYRRLRESPVAPTYFTRVDIEEALNEAYAEMSDATEWYERVLTIDLLHDHAYYDLRTVIGDDFLAAGEAFNLDTQRWLIPSTPQGMDVEDRRWEKQTVGLPQRLLPRGLWWLGYWPMGGAVGSIQQYYWALPPAMVKDDDEPGFPMLFSQGLVELALTDLWASAGESALALAAWERYLAIEADLHAWVVARAGVPMPHGGTS